MSGKYTVTSAYECQFQGSIGTFPATNIWKALSEPKCKFFAWLVMHDKILTTSNMHKRNWPCNHNCALCLCIHERREHLLTGCNFTEAAWNLVADKFALPRYNVLSGTGGPVQWVCKMISEGSKKRRKGDLVCSVLFGD
jgi:hypothetical protein